MTLALTQPQDQLDVARVVSGKRPGGRSPGAHLTVRISSNSKQTLSLSRDGKGDDCIQVFLSLIRGAGSTHRRRFDVRERRGYLFCCTLVPTLRSALFCTCHLSVLHAPPEHK